MSAVSGGERILLTGPPHNTKAVVRIDTPEVVAVTVRLDLAGNTSLHRGYVRPVGPGSSEVRLKLPRDTPAGEYRGEVKLGETTHAIVVQVAPNVRTRVNPKHLALSAEPGGRAEFDLIVSNDGNVAVDIAKSTTFDLDDGDGQDRALGIALRAELAGDERRVDRFFDELRRSHGGEGRVSVIDGAGPLGPGESRAIRCRVEIPMTTAAGRSYVGTWWIGSATHIVAVTVGNAVLRHTGRKTE
jgi:hypothetical protein